MKRAIVFSNYGKWDPTQIGFVKVTSFDESDRVNELKRICREVAANSAQSEVVEVDSFELQDLELVNHALEISVSDTVDTESDVQLYNWLTQMTSYSGQPFQCAACGIQYNRTALFVGLIFVD